MLAVTPLPGHLGVEITGVDVQIEDQPESVVLRLRQLLVDHHLLVIRARQMEPAEQIAFAGIFGMPEKWPPRPTQIPGYPELYRIANRRNEGLLDVGQYWHADGTFLKEPTAVSLWHVVKNSTDGGETLFANMHHAYETLPYAFQRELDALNMISRSGAVHPVVRAHPVTGRKALFISAGLTQSFTGLNEQQSRVVLQRIRDHLDQPRNFYSHRWAEGDLVVGDNFSVAHKATPSNPASLRILHRVTVRGDAAFFSRSKP